MCPRIRKLVVWYYWIFGPKCTFSSAVVAALGARWVGALTADVSLLLAVVATLGTLAKATTVTAPTTAAFFTVESGASPISASSAVIAQMTRLAAIVTAAIVVSESASESTTATPCPRRRFRRGRLAVASGRLRCGRNIGSWCFNISHDEAGQRGRGKIWLGELEKIESK